MKVCLVRDLNYHTIHLRKAFPHLATGNIMHG